MREQLWCQDAMWLSASPSAVEPFSKKVQDKAPGTTDFIDQLLLMLEIERGSEKGLVFVAGKCGEGNCRGLKYRMDYFQDVCAAPWSYWHFGRSCGCCWRL